MFDLKYYNEIQKHIKFLDEYKGQKYSKVNIHKMMPSTKKEILHKIIEQIPDGQAKGYFFQITNEKGMGAFIDMI
jgi:hypothetical protein